MILLAMDRATTTRRRDVDGRLHIGRSNMTKANVCGYHGSEIPGWRELGLDAMRVYQLLRHPDEIAAALDTFNNLPVLSEHVPVTAHDHQPSIVVGSTGTDAAFDGKYLTNSMVVWAADSIAGVEDGRQRELSCAYRYTPDMTPGNFEGMQYDGIMRNIVGNHVALVVEGRAGPDVLVGDESMKLMSRTALMAGGALTALVRPLLATDAKVDISSALKDVNAATFAGKRGAISAAVVALVTPHLAADQAITAEQVDAALETIPAVAADDEIAEPATPPTPPTPPAPAPAPGEPPVAAPPAPGEPPVAAPPAPAMDAAAVAAQIATATAAVRAEQTAIRIAEREVAPVVGELVALDSAAAVYKAALVHMNVALDGLPEAAYGPTFRALLAAKVDPAPVAMDTAGMVDVATRYPLPKLARS